MKKLLIIALGLGIALGTVSISFGQGDTADKTGKKGKKKKGTDANVQNQQNQR
jgi:hypothetical protein